MSTALTLYPVNQASTVLTNAALLLAASGGTTNAAPSTLVGTSTNWGEIAFNGNTGPWAGGASEPNPTGFGSCFDGTSLVGQMILAGNWSASLKLATNGTASLTLDHLKLRFWKWTPATSIYTSIGSIDLGSQTLTSTATSFSFPSTAAAAMNFASGDYLYVDLVAHITSTSGTTTTTKIKMTIGAASTSQGNVNFDIVTPGYQPTPVLTTTPGTLSFSATAGGVSPASQNDSLAETAGTATAWTSVISYGSGSGWLAISPSFGNLSANGTQTISFSCTTGALAAGTYTATVTFTASTGGQMATVTVTFTVNASSSLVYSDSPYGCTIYVSGNKTALSYETLQLFAAMTNGGTIPFYIRYQYSAKYVITGGTPSSPTYGGWGPLDETVDKILATPGLRIVLNLAYFPTNWLAIDASGRNVGYGGSGAVLPDGPAMAIFAGAVAQRYNTGSYANVINSGRFIIQIGNEEYDTGLNGPIGGTILAQTFNYAVPAIQQYASQAIIITGAIRPLSHNNGGVTQQWMQNFYTYVPQSGEPKQALPYAHDFHYYDDNSTITTAGYPAPDPSTTDNSANPLQATKPNVAGIVSIMAGVLNQYNPNGQVWCLENGSSLPNNSPNNRNSAPTDLPSQQSRYHRDFAAQMQYAGADKYSFYTVPTSGNDPRSMASQTITDFTSYIASVPSWEGIAAPTSYLYTSVDALSFEGTTALKPKDQYFSIMNPTSGALAWSLASSQTWLTAVTLPVNGMNGNQGGGFTSGTLAAGQCITFKCTADSTVSGLSTLTTLSGTLTFTIGANNYTITISLFVTPTAANPNLAQSSGGLAFGMAVNGSLPAAQQVSFTNQDSYATWWYAFLTSDWFSIDVASGTLGAGNSQVITVSIGSLAQALAPGTYKESLTVSATPVPTQYTTSNPPAVVQFVTFVITLTINTAHTPTIAVQVSTGALAFQAVASGSLPASQTFFLHNCTNAAENWTAAKTQSWLTLSPTSGSGLPQQGSNNGASGGAQATDYAVVTVSINSTALGAGTYTDTITVTLGGSATAMIMVTYIVTGSGGTQTIGVSPTSANLSQVQGGSAVSTSVTLQNTGNTTGTWGSGISYGAGSGSGWLALSPGSGTLTGGGGQQSVTVTCTPGSRGPGTYTAAVTFTLGSSMATLAVTFTITTQSTGIIVSVNPSSLAFSASVGGTNPVAEVATITNTGSSSGAWGTGITYNNGSPWLTLSNPGGTLTPGGQVQTSVYADATGLAAGTYTAIITFSGSNTTTVFVTFSISPQAPPVGGAFSNLLSLAVQKTQIVKVFSSAGQYLGILRDAPLLRGLKSTMNAADGQIKMTLPRKIDSYGGLGQFGSDNTLALGNNVQIWLYGPGLPTTGLLKFNGVIDTIEPVISEKNDENVTATLTPYGSIVADHGYRGSFALTNVDPLALFTFWFLNTDQTPGLGNVPYANPLTLAASNPQWSGLSVSYTIANQQIKSVFDIVMSMLGQGWFWRVNPDTSTVINKLSPTAQHTLLLGQHMSSLSYSYDNNQRKNVIQFQGATGISASAVGSSAAPISQGGIGERIYFAQDSRITDNNTATIIAKGLLSLFDQPLVRTKCRLFDYRGDPNTHLGYDIESVLVGDTVTIMDARGIGAQTTWGNFRWGQANWGQSGGVVFNSVVPVLSCDYNWDYIDLEVGSFQPSQDRSLFAIQKRLNDFTMSFT